MFLKQKKNVFLLFNLNLNKQNLFLLNSRLIRLAPFNEKTAFPKIPFPPNKNRGKISSLIKLFAKNNGKENFEKWFEKMDQ